VVVAEAMWTNSKLDAKVVTDLINYKLPALDEAKLDTSGTQIVLASRSGFTQAVHAMASSDECIRLIAAEEILGSSSADAGCYRDGLASDGLLLESGLEPR
jgi:hypothetical protein